MDDDEARHRFTAMYDAHRNQVWAYTACLAGRQRADDLVSDTFVVAWRRFGDIPDPALPWLLGVARNMVRQHAQDAGTPGLAGIRAARLGRDRRRRSIPMRPPPPGWTSCGRWPACPPKDREVLILTAWQELTPHESAQVIGSQRRPRSGSGCIAPADGSRRRSTPASATSPPKHRQGAQPAREDTR